MNNKAKNLLPIAIGLSVCAGIFLGRWMKPDKISPASDNTSSYTYSVSRAQGYEKINSILDIVNEMYVDDVDHKQMTDAVIPTILSQLDPHSVYIPAEDVEDVNSELEGSFSGIGVQFNIQNDTVMIVDVIAGGPSEKLGLMPGDRIIEVADTAFTGPEINNNSVIKTLRGPKGTKVSLTVKRLGYEKPLHYTITRGDIPVNSVDVWYPLNEQVGYIKVSRFGANTHNEFLTALTDLNRKGCSAYVIDLRTNSGGYLTSAINMINEFLDKGQLIVYTEGERYPRENAQANGRGHFKNAPVCVLINEWSASASEIFAGAIQDQDRGWIVGRRSFGKGLVQQQMDLSDGSALRLTVARYHTPSGRCIQKHYEQGKADEYEMDINERYNRGEFFNADSIMQIDSLRYKTRLGRTVYGGGGIMPDFFVAQDTSFYNDFYRALASRSLLYNFAFSYADRHRNDWGKLGDYREVVARLDKSDYWNEFLKKVSSEGVVIKPEELAVAEAEIKLTLKAYICRDLLGDAAFYPVINENDPTIAKALEVIFTPLR
ncbi:MAG: S41 family peptidase [Bacteroidales bacterium]|nr:S41 family peptidase [Bacteroidales bacterium]